MTTDFTACPKCGKTMQVFSHQVQRVTWNGLSVCGACQKLLRNLEEENRARDTSLAR